MDERKDLEMPDLSGIDWDKIDEAGMRSTPAYKLGREEEKRKALALLGDIFETAAKAGSVADVRQVVLDAIQAINEEEEVAT